MKFSIITVSYNSATTIEDTIKSVINQNYPNLEYIIIDGGSTDGTLEIIKKYQDKISQIISEPDKGIYDAMNKGIKMATGEVVGILNSDDFYASDEIISEVAAIFERTQTDAVYGNIAYVGRLNIQKRLRYWRAGEYKLTKLKYGWIMPHPTFFVKKEIYHKYGLFNLNFEIAADYELMFRFLKQGIRLDYIDKTLALMRVGGHSAVSIKQRFKGWRQLKTAWVENGLKPPAFFILRRILHKINQYLFLRNSL